MLYFLQRRLSAWPSDFWVAQFKRVKLVLLYRHLTTVHCLAGLHSVVSTRMYHVVGFPSRVSVLMFQSLPGLDFGVFKSLGPFVDRVQRVQMELHEHVRHEGEIPCSALDDFD